MGKSSKKAGSSSSSKGATTTPKCTCDDPYKCTCGNRPPRPSKGHKWDATTQQWGGKGHKQKGASGQTAVAEKAIASGSTNNNNTKPTASWQRLPTQLLSEYTQRQHKVYHKPKFKLIQGNPNSNNTNSLYKYRIIVPDAKGDAKKDLFFVPQVGVANEEQARQEAALLALLHLTPTLPHERTLPEPYKSTWLHAIQHPSATTTIRKAATTVERTKAPPTNNNNPNKKNHATKNNNKASVSSMEDDRNNDDDEDDTNKVAAPTVSTHLGQGRVTSQAQRDQERLEHLRQRNAKWAKRNATQMANRLPLVTMTAQMRRVLEQVLLDEHNNDNDSTSTKDPHRRAKLLALLQKNDEEDNDEDDDKDLEEKSPIQQYVQDRLQQQGFTNRQARLAYTETHASKQMDITDTSTWELQFYEPCLQWLLLHVPEDDLPVGLDPNQGQLEVVVAAPSSSTTTSASSSRTPPLTELQRQTLIHSLGLSLAEAHWIVQELEQNSNKQQQQPDSSAMLLELFWELVVRHEGCEAVLLAGNDSRGGTSVSPSIPDETKQEHEQLFQEELEALSAIFGEDKVQCEYDDNLCTISIPIPATPDSEPNNSDNTPGPTHDWRLQIQLQRGLYPAQRPIRVLVQDRLSSLATAGTKPRGTTVHAQIVQYLAQDLVLDQPAIFDIYSFVSSLLLEGLGEETSTTKSLVDNSKPQDLVDPSKSQDRVNHSTSLSKDNQSKGNRSAPSITSTGSKQTGKRPAKNTSQSASPSVVKRRPREKGPFWSTPPTQTPKAMPFPKLGPLLQKARTSLPAHTARSDFLDKLREAQSKGRVMLLTGETGCGKSTQIPQFILEENPLDAKIIVCQPRRVAATGVASRVAQERGESRPGVGSVGYVVRGDSALCKQSRLVFCTTGVLLRQMQSANALDSLTHIVLDEVHERSLDMDILLALLKEQLSRQTHLTVVLMSATLDSQKFASYWGSDMPQLHIPGRTFPVKDYFLEDVLAFTQYMPPKKKKGKSSGVANSLNEQKSTMSEEKDENDGDEESKAEDSREVHGRPISEIVARVDETEVDFKLVAMLIKYIISVKEEAGDDGSVLVFLPGAPEINRTQETISREIRDIPLTILPLHGGLQPKEQSLVFKPAEKGKHKVILSTNIAETSVTIPDCTAVIDCGREKQSSYDPSNRMPLLLETFCSKASLKQRRGRAGRVRPGTCYKLISSGTFEKLRNDTEPEILRTALDQTLLSLLFLGVDCSPSGSFITSLLDPPQAKSLQTALESLQTLGAVNKTHDKLTPLGMHLAGIPAPPIVGKILIFGCILGCRNAGLAMGAGMSLARSPLLRIEVKPKNAADDDIDPIEEMKKSKILEERKGVCKLVGQSDHAFLAKIFMDWEQFRGPERRKYSEKLGLSIPAMRDLLLLKQQFDAALSSVGYINTSDSNEHGSYWRIIRAVAVAGMAPGQLVKIVRPAVTYQETAEGAKEKQGKAQELRFFARIFRDTNVEHTRNMEEKVFVHPSSINFGAGNYSCPWVVYNSLVRTSKPFLRDVTECDEYSLLLFGGELEIQASKGVIVVDNWCQLSASPKIGTLIGGLRKRLDQLLDLKSTDPSFDMTTTPEMEAISRLILRDGA